jgi:hypothetical protein
MDPIQQALMQKYQQSDQNAKSFSDLLKERSKFVGAQEGQALDSARNFVNNGSNGAPVDPNAIIGSYDQFRDQNLNKTLALQSQADGYNKNGVDILQLLASLQDKAAERGQSQSNSNRDYSLRQKELNLQYGLSPDGTSEGSDQISKAAQGIQHGTLKISDVPQPLRARVSQKLQEIGYDPGKQVNHLVDELYSQYNGNGTGKPGDSLALGAGLPSAPGHLALKIHQALNTPLAQRYQTYNDTKEGFAASLKALTGDTGVLTDQDYARLSKLLPTENDTQTQADKKFTQMRDFINAKYNPSAVGKTAGGNQSSTSRIRVQLSNGQTGTVDSSEFDAKTMKKL